MDKEAALADFWALLGGETEISVESNEWDDIETLVLGYVPLRILSLFWLFFLLNHFFLLYVTSLHFPLQYFFNLLW